MDIGTSPGPKISGGHNLLHRKEYEHGHPCITELFGSSNAFVAFRMPGPCYGPGHFRNFLRRLYFAAVTNSLALLRDRKKHKWRILIEVLLP